MFTFLDLLVIVAMVVMASSVVSVLLMYLVKNPTVKRVCFYIVVALGLYMSYANLRMMLVTSSVIPAVVMALAAIGALVLELVRKGDEKKFLIARILATLVLVIGVLNAFFI